MSDISHLCKQLENLLTKFTWDEHGRQLLLGAQAHVKQQQYDYAASQLSKLAEDVDSRKQALSSIINDISVKTSLHNDSNFNHNFNQQVVDFFTDLYHKQCQMPTAAQQIIQANSWVLTDNDKKEQK